MIKKKNSNYKQIWGIQDNKETILHINFKLKVQNYPLNEWKQKWYLHGIFSYSWAKYNICN